MPGKTNVLKDLLKDITLTNSTKDQQQFDLLLETIKSSTPSATQFVRSEISDFLVENSSNENEVQRKIPQKLAVPKKPTFEVQKTLHPVAGFEAFGKIDYHSKIVAADKIIGPFIGNDGKYYDYNFFKFIDDFKIFFPGETEAALIIPVRLNKFLVGDFMNHTLSLTKGNVWIRANLLDSKAPKNQYIGLKINSGKITMARNFSVVKKSITIPKTSRFEISLALDNHTKTPLNKEKIGVDGEKSTFTCPSTLELLCNNSAITLQESKVFQVSTFGWEMGFQSSTKFLWNSEDRSIRLNLSPNQGNFEVKQCNSTFYQLRGKANIDIAYWLLPAKILFENQSQEIQRNGLFQQKISSGLSVVWDGIRDQDNEVQVNACHISISTGEVYLESKNADFNQIHDHFTLWQKSQEKPYKMDLDIDFRDYRILNIISINSMGDAVQSLVDTDFLIDKPILACNSPIHPKSKKTTYTKGKIFTGNIIDLNDKETLNDKKQVPEQETDFTIYQFAIENAFFTTSKEASLMLNGKFDSNNHIHHGKLFLIFYLFDLLPTLPHPYTSNILPDVESNDGGKDLMPKKIGTLQSNITWETKDDFTAAEVDFKLTQQKFPQQDERINQNLDKGSFRLLDVSTESDHWGISLNFRNTNFRAITKFQVSDVDENVVTIHNNNLQAPMEFLNGLTLPHVSWEPVFNSSKSTNPSIDPANGFLFQVNNNKPTVFWQQDSTYIDIQPKKYMQHFRENLKSITKKSNNNTSLIAFSLPNGKISVVALSGPQNNVMTTENHLDFIMPQFDHQHQNLTGSFQFRIAAKDMGPFKPPSMTGGTRQEVSIKGSSTSILGKSVDTIFNATFSPSLNNQTGVPLTHIDFSGYGASTFSNWTNIEAKFASISQAKFDILKGRTAHEIVQAVSMIYPWGIGTTRTVTFYRNNNAIIFREDSGWVAQSDGIFDFSFDDKINPYDFYPGLVEGLFNVKNIREDYTDILENTFDVGETDYYFNPTTKKLEYNTKNKKVVVKLVAVYFDADVKINSKQELIAGKQFKGYVQLSPEGCPIPRSALAKIIKDNNNSVGGSIDSTFNIEKTLQRFKANRIDVSASYQKDDPNNHIFVASVRGSSLLSSEGSWSVVEVDKSTGTVSNLAVGTSVSLIKDGLRPKNKKNIFINPTTKSLLAFPDSLKNTGNSFNKTYGILQNTDTQKLLLNAPNYIAGKVDEFFSEPALLADCFRMMNSKGPFPNLPDAITIDSAAETVVSLLPDGLQKTFHYEVPNNFSFDIYGKENDAFRIYVKYDSTDENGNNPKKSVIDYVTDPTSIEKWANKMHNVTIAVDLVFFKPLMYISGNFGNGKKTNPSLDLGYGPQLKLAPALEKIYEILEFLSQLDPSNPSEAIKKGLKIAMSNSSDSWEYKFKADKEIPVVKFPFDPINYNSPTTPLKMDAFFRIGVYYNQPIKIPNTIDQIKPSIGAYLELGANIRVMCFSLAAATIYAVGRAEVGLSADLNNPPTLYFKFGFGVELCVGLPVVGSVAVTFMMAIDMSLNSEKIVVGAILFFKGRVELFGGLVTVTISIEAAGKVQKAINGPTSCIAVCTFALDISIAFVININFTESWKETRQIS